jgi:energy-coupling factor transporter ATP-binding protein EcfA2
MFRCEDMTFSYDGVRNVLDGISFNVSRGDKVALIGYNGLGKTTLMRIIAGTRKPTGGKAVLGHNVIPGYLSQEFAETIPPDVSVYRNAKNAIPPGMNEKNFRNQLGAFGFDENDIEKLESGITLGDGTECLPAKVKSFVTDNGLPAAEIKIREGKYHQVKRMFASLGTTVVELKRIAIGGLPLDETLAEGEARLLTAEELESIVKNDERF